LKELPLHEGWPVCVGLRWPRKEVRKDDVLLWVSENNVYDGHSILFVGYQDDEQVEGGGYFILRDSNNHIQNDKMSYRYAMNYANDAIFFPLQEKTTSVANPPARIASVARPKSQHTNPPQLQHQQSTVPQTQNQNFAPSVPRGKGYIPQ